MLRDILLGSTKNTACYSFPVLGVFENHESRKIIELVSLDLKNIILCKFLKDVSKNRVSLMIKTNPM